MFSFNGLCWICDLLKQNINYELHFEIFLNVWLWKDFKIQSLNEFHVIVNNCGTKVKENCDAQVVVQCFSTKENYCAQYILNKFGFKQNIDMQLCYSTIPNKFYVNGKGTSQNMNPLVPYWEIKQIWKYMEANIQWWMLLQNHYRGFGCVTWNFDIWQCLVKHRWIRFWNSCQFCVPSKYAWWWECLLCAWINQFILWNNTIYWHFRKR